MRLAKLAAFVPLCFVASHAHAACQLDSKSNFSVALSINNSCNTVNADTAESFFKLLDSSNLSKQGLGYNDNAAASFNSNFNGISLKLGFAANSTTLTFSVPELGVSQSFTDITRDKSVDALEDFLKKNDLIGKIMKLQAANTPKSPITGPGGLLPSSIELDFAQQFDAGSQIVSGNGKNTNSDNADNKWAMAINASHTQLKDRGTVDTATLPLSYSFNMDFNPRHQLSISMPLTQVTTNGAKSYHVGLGLAYRFPITDRWSLAPAVRYGVVGSADLASVAAMRGTSLTSVYVLPLTLGDMQLSIGNMVGQYATMKFKTDDYSFDPDIRNTVYRNGLMLSQPVQLGGHKAAVEYSLIDTRYTGTQIYVKSTQEVGITIGTRREAGNTADNYYRAGISYFRGKDSNGYKMNIGYWF